VVRRRDNDEHGGDDGKGVGSGGLSGREPTLASSLSSLAVGDELHHPDKRDRA
jgi:hypothetical protein